MNGYRGKCLFINLTGEKINAVNIDRETFHKYIGGRGLGARLLYDLIPENKDAFSPETPLIFLTGPLTGTIGPSAVKFVVITKSPLTGTWLESYCSGQFASNLKYAGYDGLVVTGKADTPKYLSIDNDSVELKDAGMFWGMDTHNAERGIRKEIGDDTKAGVISTGPAGENLVRYSCITSDFFRQAGRGGAGAVMGYKKLKAIAVRGAKGIKCADGKRLLELNYKFLYAGMKTQKMWTRMKYGTTLTMDNVNRLGILPTRNFSRGVCDEAIGKINSEGVSRYVESYKACVGCYIPCARNIRIKEGEFAGSILDGPEFETLCLLGSNIGVLDLMSIANANLLCDKLGIDTVSAGNVIGWAMECYEKGIIKKEEVNGIELNFGNIDGVIRLLKDISQRKGIGDLLAEGIKRASEKIGRDSEKFAVHTKGLELPGYDPRGSFGGGLAYAITPRGGCHRRANPAHLAMIEGEDPHSPKGKASLVKRVYDTRAILHSLIVCDFVLLSLPLGIEDLMDCLNACTGYDFSLNDIKDAAERMETLIRKINIREGFNRDNDILPERIINEALPDGPAKGIVMGKENLDLMIQDYYKLRGWDKNGAPKEETLKKLGIL